MIETKKIKNPEKKMKYSTSSQAKYNASLLEKGRLS